MRLVYVSPGPLDAKAVEGLEQYAATWPGTIIALIPAGHAVETEPSGIHTVPAKVADRLDAVASLDPDVVLALHRPENIGLTRIAPTVLTAEVTKRIRTDLLRVSARGAINHARIKVGQTRLEHTYRSMSRSAAGLQCNGYAAWDAYAGLNANPMRFRDHRIRESDLTLARERSTWDGRRPLRVVFSGRVTAIKGPRTVLAVAALLPNVEFVILGEGDQKDELAAVAPSNVLFESFLPFAEWTSYMREHADLALLPHPQGDPSCTYYEALGCGVPVIGLPNTTWAQLANAEGLGWAEPDARSLATRIQVLRPEDLHRVRQRALATLEPFERVAARRVSHLVEVASSSTRIAKRP
ncbi:glycosyltransferase [Microbacterium bovistercoris]|uniref:Glycosyltransferase n=1 Tax=Microbacterium bovistercoris TaxID=2293570 RepID=A0A371NYH6_9MICO|nr:glycosyltransferase [Microbacterium bovistercoris]REJ08045.1 glycosyltransferase [Microbacterium bovistercoris]